MELPKFKTDGGMLDGIKSKLGFSDQQQTRAAADDGYYDDYDDGYADEYGDDYGEGYDEFAEYGPDYDRTRTGTRYDAPDAVTAASRAWSPSTTSAPTRASPTASTATRCPRAA